MASATLKCILLIDDEESMHRLAHAHLEKAGFRLLDAYDGASGLELALRDPPDLILLDLLMPDMSGEEVFKRLASDDRFVTLRAVPVIMLTGHGTGNAARLSLLESGVSAYLCKPFGLRELSEIVDNVFVIHDIHGRNQQLRAEIEMAHDHLSLMLRTAPVGIFSTEASGFIKAINPPLGRLLGHAETDKLMGRSVLADPELQASILYEGVAQVLASGEAWQKSGLNYFYGDNRLAILNIDCAPLRRADGHIAGVVGVVEDVTTREESASQLRMLHGIGLAMQSAIDLDELLHLILTSLTAGQAMGFSRAMIFFSDAPRTSLQGKMGVGPATAEEAGRIWQALAEENLALDQVLEKYGKRKPAAHDAFNTQVCSQRLPLTASACDFIAAINAMQTYRGRAGAVRCAVCLPFLEALQLSEFLAVPLVARDKLIGLIIADSLYGTRQRTEDKLAGQLEIFARHAAVAIEKADAHKRLEEEKTKHEQAYAELKATHTQLMHAERLATVGKMTAHVAHEIRNPLVTIGGFARSLFNKAQGNESIEKIAGIIAEETLRLEKILANVLDYTRLPKPVLHSVDLNKIIRDVSTLLSEEAQRLNIRLELNLSPLPALRLDSGQINQVLLNLLRNGIQSIGEAGSGAIAMTTSVVANQQICLRVSDNGAGIPPEMLANIFDPFFTTKPQGTGLGLAITRQIITEHGGHIEVTSTPKKGTTFFVYLPINSAGLQN